MHHARYAPAEQLVAAPTIDFTANLPGLTVESFPMEKQRLYTSAITNLINGRVLLMADVQGRSKKMDCFAFVLTIYLRVQYYLPWHLVL